MKMKKKMEPPKIEIIVFEAMDIIATASGSDLLDETNSGAKNTVGLGTVSASNVYTSKDIIS